jgi:hypothetical protein
MPAEADSFWLKPSTFSSAELSPPPARTSATTPSELPANVCVADGILRRLQGGYYRLRPDEYKN